jgi:hypothetical protein
MSELKVSVSDTDKGYAEIVQRWNDLVDKEVVAGILEKDAFTLSNPSESNRSPEITLVTKAVVHEFGSATAPKGGRIPARAPIRKGTDVAKPKVIGLLERNLKGDRLSTFEMLKFVGKVMADSIRKAVDGMSSPALAQKTIDNKGHALILKDSNQMYFAYDSEVRRARK